jgi:hypothetical protein
MRCMDDDSAQPAAQDKIMAAVGLLVAVLLAAISIDLLREKKAATGDGGD